MNTTNRMFNNADVTGVQSGSWYTSRASAPKRYPVTYVPQALKYPKLSGMGCCGGVGGCNGLSGGAFSLLPALFALVVPVALGAVVLVAAKAVG